MVAVTGFYTPDEGCWWIKEQTEEDPELGIPVRVQYIAVRRNGELAVCRHTLEGLERIGMPTHMCLGLGDTTVAHVQQTLVDGLMSLKPGPPPMMVKLGGETYVDAEHPALEVIPDAARDPTPRFFLHRGAAAKPPAALARRE